MAPRIPSDEQVDVNPVSSSAVAVRNSNPQSALSTQSMLDALRTPRSNAHAILPRMYDVPTLPYIRKDPSGSPTNASFNGDSEFVDITPNTEVNVPNSNLPETNGASNDLVPQGRAGVVPSDAKDGSTYDYEDELGMGSAIGQPGLAMPHPNRIPSAQTSLSAVGAPAPVTSNVDKA